MNYHKTLITCIYGWLEMFLECTQRNRGSYMRGHFIWNLWNEPLASSMNFIWNDYECKIMFILWPFKIVFLLLSKWILFQEENMANCFTIYYAKKISYILYQASYIAYKKSNIGYKTSDIIYEMSYLILHISNYTTYKISYLLNKISYILI